MANVTALAPKYQKLLIVCGSLCALVLLLGGLRSWHSQNYCQLKLQENCIGLEYARTPEERALGLGGRDRLPSNRGMLFVLEGTEPGCFWMKDTKVNLDIIWMDAQKQITKIEPDLSPDSYPQKFCSEKPSSYVLEVAGGVAAASQIQTGQQLNF